MLENIKGMTERRLKLVLKMGIKNIYELLSYNPKKYVNMDNLQTFADCKEGELCVVKVKLVTVPRVRYIRKGLSIVDVKVSDGVINIDCYWFNQPYTAKKDIAKEYYLIGKPSVLNGKLRFSNPMLEPVDKSDTGIVPFYSLTKGMRQKEFRGIIKNAVDYAREHKAIPNFNNDVMDVVDAFQNLHFPKNRLLYEKGIERLKFDEALFLSCAFDMLSPKNKGQKVAFTKKDVSDFESRLPFVMTDAQKKAVEEIGRDMGKDWSMNRLLQGNVGCGKTVVAVFSMYLNCKNGFQSAFMSPTEVLALQNFETVKRLLPEYRIEFLSGSTGKAEKKRILASLSDGETDIVVGTHALIQDGVEYKNLNLVVTDEQHRFGVAQRAKLSQTGCHTLIMSATPIPRTLALVAFEKLDLSLINQMPEGRIPISTHLVEPAKRTDMYEYINRECQKGAQAYIVCPLIDKSEAIDAKSVKDIYNEVCKGPLKSVKVGLLHGRMKAVDKERILNEFRNGKISVLISTTVIEVGVDVKNATIMVIENSDRFGLAALHQLRGRVGRGDKKSYCFAVVYNDDSLERLSAFKENSDGYKIALMDLSMRGMGEFTGLNQHGGDVMRFLNLSTDKGILKDAGEFIKSVSDTDIYKQIKAYTVKRYNNIFDDIILN